VNRLKEDFLRCKPAPQPEVDAYWARYQHIFSRDGLQRCDPQDLKDFANTATGARPGNMSVFNTAWNNMGDDLAARRTRDTIDFLLYGPEQIPLEDRLTALIEGDQGKGMTGFIESLLTKVLCIVQPKRFLPAPDLHLGECRQEGDRRALPVLVGDQGSTIRIAGLHC
jgi:hypothetical protein